MPPPEEKVENPPQCGRLSLSETAERALARQAELEDIRRELLALAQVDKHLMKLVSENRQKHFALAQRVLELSIQ